MSVRARKVARDLLGNRGRTLLVVVAIAVGLAGLSTTLRMRAIFTTNLDAELAAANPSSATILTEGADEAIVAAVAARPDVAAAEGRLVTFGRLAADDEVRTLRIEVRADPAASNIDRLRVEEGTWPPPVGTIAIERSSIAAARLAVGDLATVTDPTGATRRLPVAATTHDITIISGRLVDQILFAYASATTWERLGLESGFTEIAFTVTGDRQDEDVIAAVAEQVAGEVAAAGFPVLGTRIPPPGDHVLDNVISSVLLILGSLGLLSLVLSGFLVFNTVAATLARQRPQIGVMKAVGASRRDVLVLYLATVGLYSALALLVAVPAGALAARALTGELGTLLNLDITDFGAPAWVWLAELGAGLVVPIVAALGPVLSGTAATVAEVIRGSAATAFGAGRIDQMLARLQGIPESLRYAARNTFRRKLRLTLTVAALSLAGAILVSVLTLRTSLAATVDSVAAYWQQDVTVDLQQPVPFPALREAVGSAAGVETVEGWLVAPAAVVRPDDREAGEGTDVFAVPTDSTFIDPTLIEGRWLEPGDADAVVINVDLAANEPDLTVGDELVLRARGFDVSGRVVGISTTQLVGPIEPRPETPIAYVPYPMLAAAFGLPDAANRLAVAGASHDAAGQEALAAALEAELRDAGIGVVAVDTRSRIRKQVESLTTPILLLLSAMAVLFAVVGGLGLLGTMSLNVLERTAEFGVVRAVGAGGRTVLSIVLVEGVSVAVLGWLGGSVLAVPLAWVMGRAVGDVFVKSPLVFSFAPFAVVVWLVMAVVLAAVASWMPARRASRLSVRDAIAYE